MCGSVAAITTVVEGLRGWRFIDIDLGGLRRAGGFSTMGDTDLQYLSVVGPGGATVTGTAATVVFRIFLDPESGAPIRLFWRRCSAFPKADVETRRPPPVTTALAIMALPPSCCCSCWCCCCDCWCCCCCCWWCCCICCCCCCWCRVDTRKLLKFTNRPGCVRWYCDLVRVRLLLPATSETNNEWNRSRGIGKKMSYSRLIGSGEGGRKRRQARSVATKNEPYSEIIDRKSTTSKHGIKIGDGYGSFL